jgi:hypothetical protein
LIYLGAVDAIALAVLALLLVVVTVAPAVVLEVHQLFL